MHPTHRSRRGVLAAATCVAIVAMFWGGWRGLDRWWRSSEARVAAAAFEYLEDIRQAQQLHFVQTGRYAASVDRLDVRMPPPVRFSVSMTRDEPKRDAPERRDAPEGWSMTLIRAPSPLSNYRYRVTYSEGGFEATRSTIDPALSPAGIALRLAASRSGDPK